MTAKAPQFTIQRSGDRAYFDHGWLKTYHSFSFADYYDPQNMGWGAMRVLNDDRVAPARGFPMHPHRDMEIITYVLTGSLEHEDSMGNRGVVGPGGVQYMSAGSGVRHSEANPSAEEELRLIQMWVVPAKAGLPPRYGQKDFTIEDRRGRWLHVAAGANGAIAPIQLWQDASFYVARLEGGSVSSVLSPSRLGYLFVADGDVRANDAQLGSGDAVRIAGLEKLELSGTGELLFWDLPQGA